MVGQLVHVERRLFQQLGEVAPELEPQWAVWAASASFRAAWRAEQLATLMPVSVGLPGADDLVRRAPAALAVDLRSVVSAPVTGADQAAATLRLYDAMLTVYAGHLKNSVHPADEPVAIVLRRIVADLEDASAGLRRSLEVPGRTT
jgi:hypothetical protein